MHLVELLAYRSIPAAGVSIGVTQRCPLHCDHCSTNSTMQSQQLPANILKQFVDTFELGDRPAIMALSGGEALLRPGLVTRLALSARRSGVRSSVLSGLFFAKHGDIPPAIDTAIRAVDHFSVSIDAFHEREVDRTHVFSVLSYCLDLGKSLSVHVMGVGADDPYIEEAVTAVRARFGRHIPMLVNTVSSFGRASGWLQRKNLANDNAASEANPCTMAAWPVVGFDGVVAACGNDHLIGRVPAHLRLGDIHTDSWQTIRTRVVERNMLRALRVFGPQYLSQRCASGQNGSRGYCDTCIRFTDNDGAFFDRVDELMQKQSMTQVEQEVTRIQQSFGTVNF